MATENAEVGFQPAESTSPDGAEPGWKGPERSGQATVEPMESWGADGPSGSDRRPVFVVTRRAPKEAPEGGVYTFVTDGIEAALQAAQAAADGMDVVVLGGDASDLACRARGGHTWSQGVIAR